MTIDDIKRLTDPDNLKKHRLDNLAKVCADAETDEMKSMWYNKMMDLAKEYNMTNYVMRRLVH